jgi:hypothetical protein
MPLNRFIEDAEGLNSELLPRLEALQLHEENIWDSNLRFALVGPTSKASIRPGQPTLCGVSLDCRREW